MKTPEFSAVNQSLIFVFSIIWISGCSTNTPISSLENRHICIGAADYWKEWSFGIGGMETQVKCEQAANNFCAKKGKNANFLSLKNTNSNAFHPSTAEVVFACNTQEEIRLEEANAKKHEEEEMKASIESAKILCKESYGFKPDTADMGHCMLEIQKQRTAK